MMKTPCPVKLIILFIITALPQATAQQHEKEIAKEDHLHLRIPNQRNLKIVKAPQGGQWWPKAGLGLFIHWGLSSASGEYGLSWPMIPGRALRHKKVTEEEIERILKTKDFDMNGSPDYRKDHRIRRESTPKEYYGNAKIFNAKLFDADKIFGEAAKAGFKYAVLTTKHHEGFALWPSDFGNLSTKNYLDGRDLVGEYVQACRKHGLKVGFYFSGWDIHFANSHGRQDFLYYGAKRTNPHFPTIDENWNAFDMPPDDEAWTKKYDQFKVNQIKELLTRYGKIDILWFDGRVPGWAYDEFVNLQPDILFNQRWSGPVHFDSGYENHLPDQRPDTWWEMCRTWQDLGWGYLKDREYKSNAFVLSELVQARAWGGNYLLNISPRADGTLPSFVYDKMEELAHWFRVNGQAIYGVEPLPAEEISDVPAVRQGKARYLFVLPEFNPPGAKKPRSDMYMTDQNLLPPRDQEIHIKGISKPSHIHLLGRKDELKTDFTSGTLTIHIPATLQTRLVDVVKVEW